MTAAPAGTKICLNPRCRADLPATMNFCPLCGRDQRTLQVPVVCPAHVTFTNAKFCGNCGAKTGDAPIKGPETPAKSAPTEAFAWTLAAVWLLYAPLALVAPIFGLSAVICLVLGAALIGLDDRELRLFRITMSRSLMLLGIVAPPIYLFARAKETGNSAPATACAVTFGIALALFFGGTQISESLQNAQAPAFRPGPPRITTGRFAEIKPGMFRTGVIERLGNPAEVKKIDQNTEEWTYISPTGALKYTITLSYGGVAKTSAQPITN